MVNGTLGFGATVGTLTLVSIKDRGTDLLLATDDVSTLAGTSGTSGAGPSADTPCRTRRDSVRPNPVVNRKSPISAAIASFSARVATLTLISACARSTADAWVKCTTYTGASWVCSSSVIVSCSGVST